MDAPGRIWIFRNWYGSSHESWCQRRNELCLWVLLKGKRPSAFPNLIFIMLIFKASLRIVFETLTLISRSHLHCRVTDEAILLRPEKDSFRIRNFIGIAVQLDSSDKLILDREDRRGNHRAVCLSLCSKDFFSLGWSWWTIKDLGNGICTIFNVEFKKYLTRYD